MTDFLPCHIYIMAKTGRKTEQTSSAEGLWQKTKHQVKNVWLCWSNSFAVITNQSKNMFNENNISKLERDAVKRLCHTDLVCFTNGTLCTEKYTSHSCVTVSSSSMQRRVTVLQNTRQSRHSFNGRFSRTTWAIWHQKSQTNLDFAGQMLFLTRNRRRQSTKGNTATKPQKWKFDKSATYPLTVKL